MNSRPFVQTCFDMMHAPRQPHASVTGCALSVRSLKKNQNAPRPSELSVCSVSFSLEMSRFPSIMYDWRSLFIFICRVFL